MAYICSALTLQLATRTGKEASVSTQVAEQIASLLIEQANQQTRIEQVLEPMLHYRA
jgi:hypothetical protein